MKFWRTFQAVFRLSKSAVCEMSTEVHDYHDYPDAATPEGPKPEPMHFYWYTCTRCGRKFTI